MFSSSLLTGPEFPTPALLGQWTSAIQQKHLSSLFFDTTSSTNSSLRTCELVASSTIDSVERCDLQFQQPRLNLWYRHIACRIRSIKSTHSVTQRSNFQLPTSKSCAKEPPKNSIKQVKNVGGVKHHGNCSSSHAVSALVESTDSNGVRVDPQTKPPLHPNRPYGSKHSNTERDLEMILKLRRYDSISLLSPQFIGRTQRRRFLGFCH